jgi:hypothetical protein
MLQSPEQDCRHQTTVLANLMHHGIRGSGQQNVLKDPGNLIVVSGPSKEMLVSLTFPEAKPGTGPCATGAAFYAMAAVVWTKFVLKMERLVAALFVVVANDIVRAGNDAAGTPSTNASIDDLGLQFLPLTRPAGRGSNKEFLGE